MAVQCPCPDWTRPGPEAFPVASDKPLRAEGTHSWSPAHMPAGCTEFPAGHRGAQPSRWLPRKQWPGAWLVLSSFPRPTKALTALHRGSFSSSPSLLPLPATASLCPTPTPLLACCWNHTSLAFLAVNKNHSEALSQGMASRMMTRPFLSWQVGWLDNKSAGCLSVVSARSTWR